MTVLGGMITIAFVIILVLTAIMAIRNEFVFRYRKKVIEIAYSLSMKDVHEGTFSSRWWEILEYVSYNDMLLHFWRPLDSFFPPELRPKK